ncbi:MAG: sulfatase, partial [Acidobacteriota bacterium]|nr:sulfatase [Acidobacteriota bacterium]
MRPRILILAPLAYLWLPIGVGSVAAASLPNVVLISVDTLRADRVSSYGHDRRTSPRIDELLAAGVRFAQARTPVPLTGPAMASVMTSLQPHEHGATRNGIRVRPNLVAFTDYLSRRGYDTTAFVGNWTLKPELSGLQEYFGLYETILSRKRWFGLAKSEATADDISVAALEWLEERPAESRRRPFLLWVHYVEPHAPYQLQRDFLEQIGLKASGSVLSAKKRYDSEVAFVDHRIGRFLDDIGEMIDLDQTLVIFVSDHGESLGEHGYWGHGRHLYEVTLHVPMGIVWPQRIAARTVEAPASILDIGPTLLGLVGLPVPDHFQGFDWTEVVTRSAQPPVNRVTWHQAHKASVQPKENIEKLRRRGLLEVGKVEQGRKEIFKVGTARMRAFDLLQDRAEKRNLMDDGDRPSSEIRAWLETLQQALEQADELPPPSLSDEDIAALRALGYID